MTHLLTLVCAVCRVAPCGKHGVCTRRLYSRVYPQRAVYLISINQHSLTVFAGCTFPIRFLDISQHFYSKVLISQLFTSLFC